MTPETIRKIDVHLGKVLCFCLTCLHNVIRAFVVKEKPQEKVKKILFIKFIEQGATVLAYNALKEAIELVGHKNVFFAVFEENREILDILNILPEKNILAIRNKKLATFIFDTLKILKKIRREKIDATIDLEFFTRTPALFAYLTRAGKRVGMHRFTSEAPYRGNLLTHRVQYNPYLHVTKTYTLLVRTLLADPMEIPLHKITVDWDDEPAPKFVAQNNEIDAVRQKLYSLSKESVTGPIVLLNPNAGDMLPLRRWPTDRFVSLAKKILSNHDDITIVITGAPSEREAVGYVDRAIGSPRVVNFAGKTTLRELLVLYAISDILVTNDSGPSHFSILTDIDTVVLFGPETPRLYGIQQERTHIIWAGLACSPCVNVFNHRFSACKNNVCMQCITVEEVYREVKSCLKKRQKEKIYSLSNR